MGDPHQNASPRQGLASFRHKVIMENGNITVDGEPARVKIGSSDVQIGCTIISREVVKYIAKQLRSRGVY